MFRWLPFRQDLGLQLLALYLLFVGPVILAALVFDSLASVRLRRARNRRLAPQRPQHRRRTVAHTGSAGWGHSRLASVFATVMSARNDINLVYLLDARGVMLYHYPEGPGSTVGVDFSFRPYFQAALTASRPLMSAGRISPTTGQAVATAVMPVRDADGRFLGVVATNLALQQLSATLTEIASDPTSGLRVSILDATGQIVADSDPQKLLGDARADFPAPERTPETAGRDDERGRTADAGCGARADGAPAHPDD